MNAIRAPRRRSTLEPATDYGPDHRADVVREERADPDNPNRTVRGGAARDGLKLLLTRRVLSKPLYDTARRFRDDLDMADGVRGDRVIGGGFSGRCPADAQLDAIRRVRESWAVMGQTRANVVVWVVWRGSTLESYASCVRCSQERARLMLTAALELLEAHYAKGPGERT